MKVPEVKMHEICALSLLLVASPAEVGDERGELAAGLDSMEALHAAEDFDGARARALDLLAPNAFATWRRALELEGSDLVATSLDLAEPLIDLLRLNGLTEKNRAHVHFALGVVEQSAGELDVSIREFESARSRAGAGGLRCDAAYNMGTVLFLQGEAWRAQIPELGGQPAQSAPQPPVSPGAPPVEPEEQPDPLEEAREKYLEARDEFIVALELNWQDPDTRANTELVMRRLRELEEIERQREEDQQDQQQEQDQDSDEEQDQQDQQDQEDQEDQDSDEQQDQQDQQEEGEDSPEDPEDPEGEESQEEQQEEEPQQSEEAEPEEQEQPQSGQEVYLTREEVQRLLDKLERHEEQGEEIRARAQRQRQRPTARDW